MAGSQLTIEADGITQLGKELGELIDRLDKPRVAMAEVAGYLEEITRDNFDNQQAPDGSPWTALSPRYKKRKDKMNVPVNKIGHGKNLLLRDHMHSSFSDTEASISTAGETSKYAATFHFGDKRRNIAARPIFGVNDKNVEEILEILRSHLEL